MFHLFIRYIVWIYECHVEIEQISAFTKDNVPVNVSGVLFYQVTDPEKAIFSIQSYISSIKNVGSAGFRAVLGNHEYDDIISSREKLNVSLRQLIGDSTVKWGVHCTRFELQEFGPATESIAKNLEKQMEAERTRRENDLNTAAKIRTAEGVKQSEILKSEGELIRVRNEADGIRYQLNVLAEGVSRQIVITY